MSDDESWVTTDEDASTSGDSQDMPPCPDNESCGSSVSRPGLPVHAWLSAKRGLKYLQECSGGHCQCGTTLHDGCDGPNYVGALDEEIKGHSQMLSMILSRLGCLYRNRYSYLKVPDDLDQCIKYFSHAVVLSPGASVEDSLLTHDLTLLSESHHRRYHLSGNSDDLDKEIEYRTRALPLYTGEGPRPFVALSHAHSSRFLSLGNLDDLDHAIEYSTLAVSLTPHDEEEFLSLLDTLIEAYSLRPESSCPPDEVDKGIEYGNLAVNLTQEGDTKLPWRLRTLSLLYRKAFYHRGDPTDLDKCIEWAVRAVSIMPEDHPHLPVQVNSLATFYSLRFDRLKELSDLQGAIECGARALLLKPDDHQSQFVTLSNLSAFCLSLFEFQGKVEELEKGIEYSARAFSLTTHGLLMVTKWDLESKRLDTLSALYFARFEHLEDLEDLESAIECCELAISLAPDENKHSVVNSLNNLGHYVHTRWHILGDTNDLDDDIEYKTRAALLVASDRHPHLPAQLSNLGLSHAALFNLTECGNKCPTLRHALDYFRQACQSVGPPLEKLKAALRWANYAGENEMPESLDAYQIAMDLIPQVIWLGTTVTRRYDEMEELSTLAAEATSAAIVAHDYEKALEWLEQGRSIVMNQVLMLRSPLDHLRSAHPSFKSLAERFQTVAGELHQTSLRNEDSTSSNSPKHAMSLTIEETPHRHRQLTKEFDDLTSEVRQLPGFENFLKPKKAAELIAAASTGPIVIINSYDCCNCNALIVRPGEPNIVHIELPSFTCQRASELSALIGASLTRSKIVERGSKRRPVLSDITSDFEQVLGILWEDIAKPILDNLGYKPNPPASELPHITWYTTGELSSLPIHAAGIYQDPKSCVSDYVVSSYVPSLAAILATRSDAIAPVAHSNILAIGMETTPGYSSLPGTTAEIAHIQRHAGSSITYTELTKSEATTSAVLDTMERHDWVHLACHAHQSVANPTESGFFLHNGTLNLASIMRRSFKNKGLAFLSACQTAMGDNNLPDETVHLASGMLTAGYPSVIATMWSVWDKDAPFVADKVYGYLLKDGKMDHRESARALHHAILELRKEIGDDEFMRWVPFIHMGS
ncbi:hypothetical protein FRC11_008406 [Ceratobasidium sp. 423]|nr:hypothetical protein FRC11_008406 [Ceratobasidium sp. 423]